MSEKSSSNHEAPMENIEADSDPSSGVSKTRSYFYWLVLLLAVMMVVFYSGAIFSCRSFFEEQNDVGEDSWRYGFRGFVSNITNECTSWDNHDKWNEIWYDRLQTLLYMGIVGVMLAVLTLGLWVVHGTVRAPTIPTWIFASFFGIFGFLSFITLMGNCSNIPPLSPGGVHCNFAAWSSLGMFASLAAIIASIVGCALSCCECHCHWISERSHIPR